MSGTYRYVSRQLETIWVLHIFKVQNIMNTYSDVVRQTGKVVHHYLDRLTEIHHEEGREPLHTMHIDRYLDIVHIK